MGTQSSVAGYRTTAAYSSLDIFSLASNTPSGTATASQRTHKLVFSQDTDYLIGINPDLSFFYSTGVVNNTYIYGSYSFPLYRRATLQNSLNSYVKGTADAGNAGSYYGKMSFSTEAVSTLLLNTGKGTSISWGGFSGVSYSGGIGYSSQTSGTCYSIYGGHESLDFNTETASNVLISGSYAVHAGEGVDSSDFAYSQATTSITGSGICSLYKGNKTTHLWSTVSTASGAGSNSSASQGATVGYFSGGMNCAGTPSAATSTETNNGSNNVHKIVFSNDSYSLHSTDLNVARIVAAGFEG
jgi:hypothetical protein